MALSLGKTLFTPVITVLGSFEYCILVIPVSEYIACNVIRIDVFRILHPFMPEDSGCNRGFAGAIRPRNYN